MRRGILRSGERAAYRFRASDTAIRKDFSGWKEHIQLGTWVRFLYRLPMAPVAHVGRRLSVGWCFLPESGRRYRSRLLCKR